MKTLTQEQDQRISEFLLGCENTLYSKLLHRTEGLNLSPKYTEILDDLSLNQKIGLTNLLDQLGNGRSKINTDGFIVHETRNDDGDVIKIFV